MDGVFGARHEGVGRHGDHLGAETVANQLKLAVELGPEPINCSRAAARRWPFNSVTASAVRPVVRGLRGSRGWFYGRGAAPSSQL